MESSPILVIGTHRSGTTLLGRALAHHPEVAYWEEPRHVWAWRHNYRPDDLLTADDATPDVSSYIRRRFREYLESSGRSRLAEKTPSNCLRLPFIDRIFPTALYLHICRDGRAVVHSTDTVNRTDRPHFKRLPERLLGTPLREWPALVPRAWRTLGRSLFGGGMVYWGPQPPGWREWLRNDSRLEVLAKQWRYTIEPVLEFRARIPASRWLDLRYEELVADPGGYAERIESFTGLPTSPAFRNHLEAECHADRVDAWRSRLDGEALERLRPILEPPLARLSYEW